MRLSDTLPTSKDKFNTMLQKAQAANLLWPNNSQLDALKRRLDSYNEQRAIKAGAAKPRVP